MIELKFDNTLNIPSISMPIYSEPSQHGGNQTGDVEYQQTKVDGVITPLIQLDNYTIHSNTIDNIYLSDKKIPRLSVTMHDSLGIIKTLDSPGHDNMLQLQILPEFDDVYKKINMLFYITNIDIDDDVISLSARYNVPKLYDSVMKSYGKISTYELFETVAKEYGLGFCSNVGSTEDSRYIYNPNKPLIDFLDSEIEFAGKDGHVYEWWIDYWNNLNLVDIYKEYREVLPSKDLQIYTNTTRYPQTSSDDNYSTEYHKSEALISNGPMFLQSPLYVPDYKPITKINRVTDKNFETYNMTTLERGSVLVQDGDVKNDIFMEYEYGGEVFGEFDYLQQRACRDMFLSKLNSQNIEVNVGELIFGFMKGGHVNFYWYDINKIFSEDEQKKNEKIKSNIELPDDIINDENRYIINRMISGQYYIINSDISFESMGKKFEWSQTLRLGRYADEIEKYNNI